MKLFIRFLKIFIIKSLMELGSWMVNAFLISRQVIDFLFIIKLYCIQCFESPVADLSIKLMVSSLLIK